MYEYELFDVLQVTIRTYGEMKTVVPSAGGSSNPLIQPINIQMDLQRAPLLAKMPQSPTKRPLSRRVQGKRSEFTRSEMMKIDIYV